MKNFFKNFSLLFYFLHDFKKGLFPLFLKFNKFTVGLVNANINPRIFSNPLPVIFNFNFTTVLIKFIIFDIFNNINKVKLIIC